MKQFELPKLPYELDALEPVLSKETLDYHYGKHHAAYVTKLNELIAGTDFANMPIEDIVARSEGPMFNNSAQAFNHTFYWDGMRPPTAEVDNPPTGAIAAAINEAFGSFESFKTEFSEVGATHFASGWAWFLKNKAGKLEIKGMRDADTPIKDGDTPLLALDVWEHAYYIDYRNERPDYIAAFWQLVNWEFVEGQLLAPKRESLMLPVDK